ncbi:hypothetical protein JQ625_28250 [Bradyrhizobium diazoefficiens]|nr:hypothetical protein [Bradyrhizobium diazoefficiens]MBR0778737.1 hypothetical protein [Bradyrhizobium diazoefficiens]
MDSNREMEAAEAKRAAQDAAETQRWVIYIEAKIAAAKAELRDESLVMLKGLIDEVAKVFASRKQEKELRAKITALEQRLTEVTKAMPRGSNEFFYLDANGNKQDRGLHGPILRAVDGPKIDEKIMGPIRAKHRARWLEEQKARRLHG